MAPLLTSVRELLVSMEDSADEPTRALLRSAQDRLGEPLRVAFAGRIKAGKSTLLNGIIGADIAASDAAECTRYVTWYVYGDSLEAYGVAPDGQRQRLEFVGRNEIDVGPMQSIERLEVEYPSPMLRTTTLIDTPGIASISEDVAARSEDFLVPPSSDQGADVLIYLLRFLHERDANFLEAFTDPSANRNDPLRSLAVLSRADEVGAGRGDGFAIAELAAERYRRRPELRGQVSDVLPVSGLIGLHAESLSDDDLRGLRTLAELPLHGQERVLLSAERFVGQLVPGVAAQQRESLLARLGLHGVRLAVALIRREPTADLDRIRSELLTSSGIVPLRTIIANRYANRSDVLKASRALDLVRGLISQGVGGRSAHREFERIEANAQEIVEIRTLREIARAHLHDEVPRTMPSERLAAIESALGADGIRLHERLRLTGSNEELTTRAAERIAELRSAMNLPSLPRKWQGHVRVAIRSIESARHRDLEAADSSSADLGSN